MTFLDTLQHLEYAVSTFLNVLCISIWDLSRDSLIPAKYIGHFYVFEHSDKVNIDVWLYMSRDRLMLPSIVFYYKNWHASAINGTQTKYLLPAIATYYLDLLWSIADNFCSRISDALLMIRWHKKWGMGVRALLSFISCKSDTSIQIQYTTFSSTNVCDDPGYMCKTKFDISVSPKIFICFQTFSLLIWRQGAHSHFNYV